MKEPVFEDNTPVLIGDQYIESGRVNTVHNIIYMEEGTFINFKKYTQPLTRVAALDAEGTPIFIGDTLYSTIGHQATPYIVSDIQCLGTRWNIKFENGPDLFSHNCTHIPGDTIETILADCSLTSRDYWECGGISECEDCGVSHAKNCEIAQKTDLVQRTQKLHAL